MLFDDRLAPILFNLVFYANIILQMVIFTPFYFLAPRKLALWCQRTGHGRAIGLMEKMVGTTFEVEGRENLPEGSYIFAPKHQVVLGCVRPACR